MKRALIAVCLLAAATSAAAEIASLSQVFAPGKGVQDLDGDGLPERIELSIIVADNAGAAELALAADIAARANLESLAADYGLVRKASEAGKWGSLPTPILLGRDLAWAREAAREMKIDLDALGPDEGIVFVFSYRNQRGIVCAGGSTEALLRTGRAFFLRWPYLWEIWGRETGATFTSLESDLARFLSQEQVDLQRTIIREARYAFPPAKEARGAQKSLAFNTGEIVDLGIEVSFADADDYEKSLRALDLLRSQRRRGLRSEVLSYPACARISFDLGYGKRTARIVLPRSGSSRRLLTPAFKEPPRGAAEERDFDLSGLFTAKGLYGDLDQDGVLDAVETTVIIPAGFIARNLGALAAKLMLPAAGGSFPLVVLDSEVEAPKGLTAPVLVGLNTLTQELVRTGRVKFPPLENAWGIVKTVPRAFGKSGALLIHALDTPGLEKTLDFMARSFPAFDDARPGRPAFRDVVRDFERLLRGEMGAAEAWFQRQLEKTAAELKDRELERFAVRLALPRENRKFEDGIRKYLETSLRSASLEVRATAMREAKPVFRDEAEFTWEVDDALALLSDKLAGPGPKPQGLKVSLGVSESPEVRRGVRKRIEEILLGAGVQGAEVEVLSAYKPGFFWLTERILPALKGKPVHHLLVRFAEEHEAGRRLKRFYAEPSRWLQELYPVDEFLAGGLAIPVDRVEFEMKDKPDPVYEVTAFDDKNGVLLQQTFSPRVREIPYLTILPEWGTTRVTTGWLRLEEGSRILYDAPLETDLEKVWTFYQERVLKPLHKHVLAKTGQAPTFAKQPYFKRLLVEVWLSEPDYQLGLDEERVSSLESLHDEIYFDTLDGLRGITGFDPEEVDLPPDTSRSSAPGNVLPLIHPSLEGSKGRVRAELDDVTAAAPEMEVIWKEAGRDEVVRKTSFPPLKPKGIRLPEFVYNGQEERIENLVVAMEFEKEADYLAGLDLFSAWRSLAERGLIEDPPAFPRLKQFTARLSAAGLEKEEPLPVAPWAPAEPPRQAAPRPDEAIVPTDEIILPERCLDIVGRLDSLKGVRSYIAGRSFEGRPLPVLELFLPLEADVSMARLVTFKPTLQVSARQHANEVAATNYALKLVEFVARDRAGQDVLRKMNLVVQPLENPDGAVLAGELLKTEPLHSLHAGRYGALGMDIGSQTPANKDLLPEAAARAALYDRWLPDIYLNLHGYPSHEWVQSFSGYVPFLFRDYWIPRGWFAYFKAATLPIYEKSKEAAEDLVPFITQELGADERARETNRRLYDRYTRWATRWQPHLGFLELVDGVNLYAKRRAGQETRLSFRTRTTFVEETPEVMDETATGPWLSFLCEQGLAYLRAHVKYLGQAKFEVARIEEEIRDRVRISFHRARPGSTRKSK
jgi:hypothetical protein